MKKQEKVKNYKFYNTVSLPIGYRAENSITNIVKKHVSEIILTETHSGYSNMKDRYEIYVIDSNFQANNTETFEFTLLYLVKDKYKPEIVDDTWKWVDATGILKNFLQQSIIQAPRLYEA